MPVRSGKTGTVTTAAGTVLFEITKWSFTQKAKLSDYCSNQTNGFKARVTGTMDGSGNCEGVWNTTSRILTTLKPGELITLRLFTVNQGAQIQLFVVPVAVEQFKIDTDVDNGEVIKWTMDWGTNGAWFNAGVPANNVVNAVNNVEPINNVLPV